MKHPLRSIVFIILISLLFINLSSIIEIPSVKANDISNWWNTAYLYRQSHVFQNLTGTGTNYQVNLTINYGTGTSSGGTMYCNNHSKSDFSDLRFISMDNTTAYDFWRESYTTNTTAFFWIEISEDLSSTNRTVWIYYGNSGATYPTYSTDTIQGNHTFPVFDHFLGTSVDTTVWTVTGTPTVSSSILTGSAGQEILSKTKVGAYNYATRFRMSVSTGTNPAYQSGFGDGTAENNTAFLTYNPPTQYGYNNNNGTGTTAFLTAFSASTYYVYASFWNSTLCVYYRDSATVTITTNVPTMSLANWFRNRPSYGGNYQLDWTLIRKYVFPEPNQGSWSAQDVRILMVGDTYYFNTGGYVYINNTLATNGTFNYRGLDPTSWIIRRLVVPNIGNGTYTFKNITEYYPTLNLTFVMYNATDLYIYEIYNRTDWIYFDPVPSVTPTEISLEFLGFGFLLLFIGVVFAIAYSKD
jgi:hypothetical protein